jgi:hypothetical protein
MEWSAERPNMTGDFGKYVVEVWSPKVGTLQPMLLKKIDVTTGNKVTIGGLLAGTKYTIAVKAVDTGDKDMSPYAVATVSTAAYAAVKVDLKPAKDTVTLPKTFDDKIGISGANYQSYALYWLNGKEEVYIGYYSLTSAPSAPNVAIGVKASDLLKDLTIVNTKAETDVKALTAAKTNFVLKAAVLDGAVVSNCSVGAKIALERSVVATIGTVK